MTATFEPEQRRILAGLADVLIPSGAGFPSASEIDVTGAVLDRILAVRPELVEPLLVAFQHSRDRHAGDAVEHLRSTYPDAYRALADIIPRAYFMHEQVAGMFSDSVPFASPAKRSDPDELDCLLAAQRRNGPIYRATTVRTVEANNSAGGCSF